MFYKKAAFFGTLAENSDIWNENALAEDVIATALADSGFVDATEVQVAVNGDEARLTGVVHLREEVTTAGNIALGVKGINRVRNAIRPRERTIASMGKDADARAQSRTL